MEEFAEVVGRSLLDSDLNVAKEFAECAQHHPWVVEGISVKDLWDLMVCLTQERNPEDAPRVVFLRRGLEFLEQEYAHYLESEMGKGMAMGEPQELSPVLSYSRHQQLAAFGSDMEESPWADLYFAMRAGAMRMESCRRWILEHMSIPDQELIESYLLFCLVRLCWGGRLCILLRLFPSQRYFSPPHLPSAESVLLLVAVPFSPTIAALQILSSAWSSPL